jgi:hypothetical protein
VGLSRNVSIVFEGIRTICQHAASWSESRSPRVVFHFASVNRSGEHRRRAVVSSREQKHGKPNAIPKGLLDNPHAADVFADGATGWFYFNGNIRITFESVWCNHESAACQVTRVVIWRLVMSWSRQRKCAEVFYLSLNHRRAIRPQGHKRRQCSKKHFSLPVSPSFCPSAHERYSGPSVAVHLSDMAAVSLTCRACHS